MQGLSVPVSYTHLDVYKRQGITKLQGTCSRRIDKMYYNFVVEDNLKVTDPDIDLHCGGQKDLRSDCTNQNSAPRIHRFLKLLETNYSKQQILRYLIPRKVKRARKQ